MMPAPARDAGIVKEALSIDGLVEGRSLCMEESTRAVDVLKY